MDSHSDKNAKVWMPALGPASENFLDYVGDVCYRDAFMVPVGFGTYPGINSTYKKG